MDSTNGSNGLGKLFPKSITSKRRRRKVKSGRDSEAAGPDDDARSISALSSRRHVKRKLTVESDDTISTNLADDDLDDRSLGSYESGGAERGYADTQRPASSPVLSRPAAISARPPQIGSLTTSSPNVQGQHSDPKSRLQSSTDLGRPSNGSGKSSPSSKKVPQLKTFTGFSKKSSASPTAVKIASADSKGRASTPKIQTAPASPGTPSKATIPAPIIVNTPPTPTDRIDCSQSGALPSEKLSSNGSGPGGSTDGSQGAALNMNIHRRTKSGSAAIGPSKLSHITTAPLTPTDETASKTPPSATGFFSSMLSAAQNAANSISNTIPSPGLGIGGNKSRTSINKSQVSPAASQSALVSKLDADSERRLDDTMDQKELAIQTLGSGDLRLSHLGLAEPSAPSPTAARFSDVSDTRTRSDSAPADPQTGNGENLPIETSSRPRSLVDAASGDRTPPMMELADVKAPAQRTSSLRSAIKPHRKRGSSVTTSGTVATAVASASSPAWHSNSNTGAPKLTGFAIASKKRNRDFHNLFKSVPDDDYLIEDYSCALQREILAHGRLYVSEGHLCFSSNILGWTTTLVMSFDEIVSVEKRSTALVFKNGLMISTLHAKHIFASFTSRDATYDLIVNIWKLGHPTLRSTLNGVQLEGTGGDKTEKVNAEQDAAEEETQEASGSEQSLNDEDDEEDEEEFYDEEEHNEHVETQSADVTALEPAVERLVSRKVSSLTTIHGGATDSLPKEAPSSSSGSADFPGPVTHAPTECGDTASHHEKILADGVIPAPMGQVYNIMFGPGSVVWMNKWLSNDQKCTTIQMEDKKGLTGDNKTRTLTFIRPLNGSIGPKQTKCFVTESIEQIDLEKAVSVSVSTQTPEVPYGNLFTTKTKYCLSWAEDNATRVQINCAVEWSGKCWLKGTIEKNVNDGQVQYCKELFTSLKSAVSTRPRSGAAVNGILKGKKKLKRNKALQSIDNMENENPSKSDGRKQNWGPLEPLQSILAPLIDILQPLLTGNVMYGLLVGLVVAMWFGFGATPRLNPSYVSETGYGHYNPSRQVAYDEIWRRQDSELWEWLEERVGTDRLNPDQPSGKKRVIEHGTLEEKLREEQMDEREVREAIRVTEEKLRILREVIEKGNTG